MKFIKYRLGLYCHDAAAAVQPNYNANVIDYSFVSTVANNKAQLPLAKLKERRQGSSTQSVIADHQLPPIVCLLSEPCLRVEPGKMLALVVGCWLLAAKPPRASSVNPLGLAETAKGREDGSSKKVFLSACLQDGRKTKQ